MKCGLWLKTGQGSQVSPGTEWRTTTRLQGCSSSVSCCYGKNTDQNLIEEGRVYLAYTLESIIRKTRAETWRQELNQRSLEAVKTWFIDLFPSACRAPFLVQCRPVASHCELDPHQSAVEVPPLLSHRLLQRLAPSVRFPFSQLSRWQLSFYNTISCKDDFWDSSHIVEYLFIAV